MTCLRHGQYRSAKAATAAASTTGHSAINAETAGFNIPPAAKNLPLVPSYSARTICACAAPR